MENEEVIYIDPEEEEVFFGNVTDREKSLISKFVTVRGSPRVAKEDRELDIGNVDSISNSEISVNNTESKNPKNEEEKILSNTAVELDHTYSTPTKQKIDKTILSTPKSIVKADKDGGFLKVLSEIALVKAEAEADDVKNEDEDKENRIIPEIRITEATPKKSETVTPTKSINARLRRFRVIYNSPVNVEPENCQKIKSKDVDQVDIPQKPAAGDLIDFDKSVVEQSNKPKSDLEEKDEGFEKIDIICRSTEKKEVENAEEKVSEPEQKNQKPESVSEKIRFSKDARKVLEVLKGSVTDDTLNFTIPEIDVDEVENCFVSPDPVSGLDVTVIAKKPETPQSVTKLIPNKPIRVVKTVEKEKQRVTPMVCQSKMQQLKYFSDRRVYNKADSGSKVCAKKLDLEEKRVAEDKKNCKGVNGLSKIPVFGTKSSKVPVPSKITPMKTLTGSSSKNSKFKNVESPIGAYIHNKPTSLIVNVKPETKKNLLKLSKIQPITPKSQTLKPQNPIVESQLAFAEYKSTTPVIIKKRPESKLPRLAPNVQRLLGNRSPTLLKHMGRFCVKTPKKETSTDETVVADANEVSLLVCKTAQKGNGK